MRRVKIPSTLSRILKHLCLHLEILASKSEQMYYLKAFATLDSDLSIMIVQEQTVIQLSDGLPQRLRFKGKQDFNKHAIYTLPDGDYPVHIQVKSNTKDFYPRLYVKYYPNIDVNFDSIEFPPSGQGYFNSSKWDYKLGVLNHHESF